MSNYLFALIINGIVIAIWIFLLVKNKNKGLKMLRVGWQTIFDMLPLILIIISALGIFSSFVSPDEISKYLGDQSGAKGFLFISVISSFMQIPGIIAFPIAAMLLKSGATIAVVAVFACASTMSSVITLPIEMKYLGKKLPFLRIGLTYIVCVIVGSLTGLILHLL